MIKKTLLSSDQIHIRDHGEYISLLNLNVPNSIGVINKALFDFLIDPQVLLQNFPDIEIGKLGSLLDPLRKKHLLDTSHPIYIEAFRSMETGQSHDHKEAQNSTKTLSCWIHLTNQCNLDCSYCYIHKDGGSMSANTAEKIIASLKKTVKEEKINRVNLSFAGGEPLMNFPVLEKFVSLAKTELGVKIGLTITTNAILLDTKNLHYLNQEKFSMYVSLDGMEKYHDAQRYFKGGKGSFKSVIQGLDAAIESFKGKISIGIVVSPDNVDGIAELTEYLLKRNIQFKYSFYRPNPNNLMECLDLDAFQNRLIEKLRQCFAIIANNASEKFNPETIFDKLTPRGGGRKQVCSMGDTYFAISHTGEISNCHMTQQEPLFSATVPTNIVKTLQNTRGNIATITANDLTCRECKIVNICKSGCRLVVDKQTKKSMYHKTYITLFDEFIDLIGALQWKHTQKKNSN